MKPAVFMLFLFFTSAYVYANSSEPISETMMGSESTADPEIDTSVIDTSVIDTSVIDTSVIDTSVIDTSVIDTSVIDTSVIDAGNAQGIKIPYKKDKALSEQTTPVIMVLLVFAILVVGFLYFFKNKLSLVSQVSGKNINLLEVKRLNTRLSAYHLKIKNRELLILQSGDNIKTVELESNANDQEDL